MQSPNDNTANFTSNTDVITFIEGEPPIPSTHRRLRNENYRNVYNQLVSNIDVWAKVNTLHFGVTSEPVGHRDRVTLRFSPEVIDQLDRLVQQAEAESGQPFSRNDVIQNLIADAAGAPHLTISDSRRQVSSSIITRQQRNNFINAIRTRCSKDGLKLNVASVFNDNTNTYDIWMRLTYI